MSCPWKRSGPRSRLRGGIVAPVDCGTENDLRGVGQVMGWRRQAVRVCDIRSYLGDLYCGGN